MPDTRTHRGPETRDAIVFGGSAWPTLRAAVSDLAWLLGRSYAPVAALKLVGDRYSLTERQRQAIRRACCSDESRARRETNQVMAGELSGGLLVIDGFNVLTTVEAALGGAVIFLCRDATYRDLAGVHGTYRKVAETLPALETIAAVLSKLAVARVLWLFDRPVSNSGRLRSLVHHIAVDRAYHWSVELVDDPDRLLESSPEIIATADSAILDAGPRWFNLARHVIDTECPGANIIDLSL
jgi:hypothetical protein